ncbi:hypothetical protein ACWGIU_04500 [Streptomyces sp. NPDC054840]
MGFRYRVNLPIPGVPRRRADVTFTRWRTAAFVQGCFWHAAGNICPLHVYGRDRWQNGYAREILSRW